MAQISADEEASRALRNQQENEDYLERSLLHTARYIPSAQAARREAESAACEESKFIIGCEELDNKRRTYETSRAVFLANREQSEINRSIKRSPSTQPKIVNPTEHLEIKAMRTKDFIIGSNVSTEEKR